MKSHQEELREHIYQLENDNELEEYDFYEIVIPVNLLLFSMEIMDTTFLWMKWQASDECRDLMQDSIDIEAASKEAIRKYITFIFRKDRFCDGFLYDFYQNGRLLRLLKRLYKLIQ